MAGLTGTDLLNRIEELGEIDKADLIAACGYGEDERAFNESLLASQGIEENDLTEEGIQKNISTIGSLSYRWLYYQFDLDHGLEDQQLADQQVEFEKDLLAAATKISATLGAEAGVFGADFIGVTANLFAYTTTNRFDERLGWTPGNPPTQEQNRDKYIEVLTWVKESSPFKGMREIMDVGYSQKEIEDYDKFRKFHHSTIGTYLRTICLTWAYDGIKADSDAFKQGVQDAKAFLSMLEDNCRWTTEGIALSMLSCIQYDLRCEKPIEETEGYVLNLLYQWVEDGNAIREEYSKKKG